jgi:hypothetical protein
MMGKGRRCEGEKLGRWEGVRGELGPGVVLLVAELCRGYRCGHRKRAKKKTLGGWHSEKLGRWEGEKMDVGKVRR